MVRYMTNVNALDNSASHMRQHGLIDRHNAAVIRAAHFARSAVAQSATGSFSVNYARALQALQDVEVLGQQIICGSRRRRRARAHV